MVMHHHAWYDGNPSRPDLVKGKDCPLGTRILTIADAYDTDDLRPHISQGPFPAEKPLPNCDAVRVPSSILSPGRRTHHIFSDSDERKSKDLSPISYETAVSIGQTIESLAYALDKRKDPIWPSWRAD